MGRTMFDVRSSFVRRQKFGVRVRLLTDEHFQCSFDVQSTVRRTFNEHRKQNLSILEFDIGHKLDCFPQWDLDFLPNQCHFQNFWMQVFKI